MARYRFNPNWQINVGIILDKIAGGQQKPFEHISSDLPVIQWLIHQSIIRGVGCKVINLGAGVRKFTTDTTVCPKCGGTGKAS